MMVTSRMNIKSAATSLVTFVVGVILISILVSVLLVIFYGPSTREPRTIIIERPDYYRGWWGHYGAGLPGWGGPKHMPPPPPHPKPQPPPPAPAPKP